ncbi:MAG: HIG1 domain-containing protein [Pseudomonadota bacterium]
MIFPFIFITSTLLVLVFGVLLMARGGKMNRKYSNKFMIMRVVLQGAAIVSIGILYYFKHSGN